MNKNKFPERDEDSLAAMFGAIALAAGLAILDARRTGYTVRSKPDSSPVTDADERAEKIILAALAKQRPDIPVVAEECASRGELPEIAGAFILVDALDGTREFLSGSDDFTVNIALVRDRAPVAGAVFAPALRRLWIGGRRGFVMPAEAGEPMPGPESWRPLQVRQGQSGRLSALISRSHMDDRSLALLERLSVSERKPVGSSMKFCLIAEGAGDVYPRFGPTMQWDTAAGEAVLRAAGGVVLGVDGAPLHYGAESKSYRNEGFVAWGDPALAKATTIDD